MIKKETNTTLMITTVVCLLPVILALLIFDKLPSLIPVHFDNAGNPDNYMPKTLAAYGLPVFMAAINLYTHFRLDNDPKAKNASAVVKQAMKWVLPIISVIVIPFSLFTAMGVKLPIVMAVTALGGVVIVICGNYLPKCRQNYTVGIKLPWTLDSEKIWNKTHRFAGFVWVIGGLIIMANAFWAGRYVNLAVIVMLVISPIVYSYLAYKNEITESAH